MDILQELRYIGELLQGLLLVVDPLVTVDSVEWFDNTPHFVGKRWTPSGYVLMNNKSYHIFYNDYLIHRWCFDAHVHQWKEGKYYPMFKNNMLFLLGAGGIITRVCEEGIETVFGAAVVNEQNQLTLDEDFILVKNGNYSDCYGNVITSKVLFITDTGVIFAHCMPDYCYNPPRISMTSGAKLVEKEPPTKKELYYAANLTELVEKYFPQF
jgi:hypothetical protein